MERLLTFLEEHVQKVTLHDQQQTEIIEDTIQLVLISINRFIPNIYISK